MARAPRYRQKLARVPLSLHDPVWVDDGDFDVDRHVRHGESADLGIARYARAPRRAAGRLVPAGA